MDDLRPYTVTNDVWNKALTICNFLESAASLTECQSGSSYATLSMTVKAFKSLLSKCKTIVDGNDPILSPIAEKMADKLNKYDSVLCSELAKLAQIVDPRFGSDILSDSDILRKYVVIPEDGSSNAEVIHNEPQGASGVTFMQTLLNEDSLLDLYDDEVVSFLRATSIGDKRADPFEWWRSNEKRYPTIAPLARDVLAIQASSVCSEEGFSIAGNLVDAHRTRMSDNSIRSYMLVCAWRRLLGSKNPIRST